MTQLPAILGNPPAFTEKVNVVRPVLPNLAEMSGEIDGILSSGMVTKGKILAAFEAAAAEHLGVPHAVAVSSCTSGLMLVYQALGLTGEVITPSFTWMATVSALVWAGLTPVFADVNPATTNLDPAAVARAITPRTSAIVAVHNFGNPAEIAALESLAAQHGLKLIFDAAHGFGALYDGAPVGAQGDAQVFSLSPTKLLITGEGGIVSTRDAALAERIRLGREYGNQGAEGSLFAGLNARMPEFNALLGLHSLERLEDAAQNRNEMAAVFQEALGQVPGVSFQEIRPQDRCSYKDFSLLIDPARFGVDRDTLAIALAAENIETKKYYSPPVHRQPAYRRYADGAQLPNTDQLADNSLSLPIWSHMQPETALKISAAIANIHRHAGEVNAMIRSKAS